MLILTKKSLRELIFDMDSISLMSIKRVYAMVVKFLFRTHVGLSSKVKCLVRLRLIQKKKNERGAMIFRNPSSTDILSFKTSFYKRLTTGRTQGKKVLGEGKNVK